jgi:hypothetical protein
VNVDGPFTYTSTADCSGPDSLTYVANDGSVDSAPATVSIDVTAVAVEDATVTGAVWEEAAGRLKDATVTLLQEQTDGSAHQHEGDVRR